VKELNKIVVQDENTIEAYERCTCVDSCTASCMQTIVSSRAYDDNFKLQGYPKASMGGVGCIPG